MFVLKPLGVGYSPEMQNDALIHPIDFNALPANHDYSCFESLLLAD